MGRLAEDPKKRKEILIIGVSLLTVSVLLIGWGVTSFLKNRLPPQNTDPTKTVDPIQAQKIVPTNSGPAVVPTNGLPSSSR
jgi:hypothetical protein